MEEIQQSILELLKKLINTPSFSGDETKTADLISSFLDVYNINHLRLNNNIVARSKNWNPDHKTLLLNSHHDTVKVVNGWTKDPFGAEVNDGILYGLGSNDAGASLVSLLGAFVYLYEAKLNINIIIAATAEEENFGPLGVKSILATELKSVDFGIVGEPTVVIDFRVNDCYTLQEGFEIVQDLCESTLKARSFNNNPSGISKDHPLAKAGKDIGLKQFGSATLSDQAHMRFPTIKMGPGFSERSHTPDEHIKLEEIKGGLNGYIKFIKQLDTYFATT
ncbi:UNVERIFIED_CONTAM: hypothetical protein GTU68_030629 [Idotea baltica]|nr:hypothetical protein [Idotea baltica]